MDEGSLGILLLVGLSLAVAIVVHWFHGRLLSGSLLSAIVVVVLFHAVAWVQLGYFDPFFLISIVTAGVGAFVIALVVGSVLRWLRGWRRVSSRAL